MLRALARVLLVLAAAPLGALRMSSSAASALDHVEGEVSALRNAPEERGEGMSAEEMLRAAQAEHDERAKVQGQERLAVQNVMLAALDALMGHKQQIQDALDATCANGNVAVEGFR